MMTRLTGTLNRVLDEELRVQVGPFEYQVLVPEFVRRQVQTRVGETFTFHLIEFLEGNQMSNRMTPRKVGFLHESELEFFELFCTVDKIGVKKGLKALGRPIREMADAIQRQDTKWLTTMPGIGKTTADQIVATLRSKVTKFVLFGETPADAPAGTQTGPIYEEAYTALLSLGMSPIDARTKLDQAARSGETFTGTDAILKFMFRREN